jgi:hypothetical protein
MILATPRIVSANARRRFTATLAGAALALGLMTAAAVPARASDAEDLAKALAAIAAVAIIAKAIDKDNDRARPAPVEVDRWGHGGKPAPGWDRGARRLPAQCAIEVPGRHRSHVFYSENCLRRAGVEGRLPRRCEQDVRVRGRYVTVFPEDCLIEAGFRRDRGRSHDRGYERGDGWQGRAFNDPTLRHNGSDR